MHTELGKMVGKIRSKNAGPFWLTIDIFCNSPLVYQHLCKALSTDAIANVFGKKSNNIKRFDIESLSVIKFSLPRPAIQGSLFDQDMHGASWAALISEVKIKDMAQ